MAIQVKCIYKNMLVWLIFDSIYYVKLDLFKQKNKQNKHKYYININNGIEKEINIHMKTNHTI